MNSLEKIYDILKKEKVVFIEHDLDFTDALVVETNGKYAIVKDSTKFNTSADELVAIAHEAGHIFTGSLHTISSTDLIGKHEKAANRWAIKRLLPYSNMKQALENGYCTKYELAEYFDVTEDFVQMAYDYYVNECGLSF